MKRRSAEILQKLLNHPKEGLSLRTLSTEYGISEKTLKSDIREILDFEKESGSGSFILYDGQKISLNSQKDSRVLWKLFYEMDAYQYKMSPEERKMYIILVLLDHDGYYSMQQLAEELYVTRNTIINDCRLVEEHVQKYEVVFEAKTKKGIRIDASEEIEEEILIDIFSEMLPLLENIKKFFVQYMIRKAGFVITLKEILCDINEYMEQQNLTFAGDLLLEISVILFVLLNRKNLYRGQSRQNNNETAHLQLDQIGRLICYVAKKRQVSFFSPQDAVQIEKKILKRSVHPQVKSINDFELCGVVCHFLLETGRNMNLDIQDDNLLVESLLSHIKNMHGWKESDYDWKLEEQNADFLMVKKAAEENFVILENYLKFYLTLKMKESIVIHICASLLRSRQNVRPLRVIISCPGSMATSKYLEAQIKNYFNFNIVGIMTAQQVRNAEAYFKDAELIISTVPVQECDLPAITVSPLMTVTDIRKIQDFAFRQKKETDGNIRNRYPVLDRIHAIYANGKEADITYLDRKLKQVLDELVYMKAREQEESALLRMLDIKYICKIKENIEWRSAIKLAAADLIRDGFFDERYVREAIGNVEEYGNYIIVNRGIALAHAGKDSGVYQDGISLLVSEDGVVFEGDEKVHLLFVFSQKGETDYIELFREIIRLGEKDKNIERIRKASDGREIYRAMKDILAV